MKRFLFSDFVNDKSLKVEIFFLNPVTNKISFHGLWKRKDLISRILSKIGFFCRILTTKRIHLLISVKNKIYFRGWSQKRFYFLNYGNNKISFVRFCQKTISFLELCERFYYLTSVKNTICFLGFKQINDFISYPDHISAIRNHLIKTHSTTSNRFKSSEIWKILINNTKYPVQKQMQKRL